MERPAPPPSSRHLMAQPSPRTLYVHKQKSREQLRRISSNSLAGPPTPGADKASRRRSLHVPLQGELRTGSAGIAGEG